jgi:homocysteine S-methyltransferase
MMIDGTHLTDSGLETDLLFHHGVDLPHFAAFPLLDDASGRALLEAYFREHVQVAAEAGLGIVLETPTWRASSDWGVRLGYDAGRLAEVNAEAVALVRRCLGGTTGLVSGCLGPRGDGYVVTAAMTSDEARDYHAAQVAALVGADLVSALTLGYAAEAVGIVQAAQAVGMPVVVSFTVETDGRLPDGSLLADAVQEVDDATGGGPAWFMVNCAHPDHVAPAFATGGSWRERVRALRVNASRLSHAELDEADELDEGDPAELSLLVAALHRRLPQLAVLGGCCGTDARHVREIARRLRDEPEPTPARNRSGPPE